MKIRFPCIARIRTDLEEHVDIAKMLDIAFPKTATVAILGELSNMPGHYVVASQNKTIPGLHLDYFEIIEQE